MKQQILSPASFDVGSFDKDKVHALKDMKHIDFYASRQLRKYYIQKLKEFSEISLSKTKPVKQKKLKKK